jgi:hypothetical protein
MMPEGFGKMLDAVAALFAARRAYFYPSSGKRVGDFGPFLNRCLLFCCAVGMWATRLRCPSCP